MKDNPADYVSRGISMGNREKIEQWIHGPKFLWEPEDTWNTNTKTPDVNSELKKVVHVNQIVVQTDILSVLDLWSTYPQLGQKWSGLLP